MVMKEGDFWRQVLQQFLPFLGRSQVELIVDYLQNEGPFDNHTKWILRVLGADETNLKRNILPDRDSEDNSYLVNVFLWKQRLGEIDRESRVEEMFWDIEEHYLAWYAHRAMLQLGCEGVADHEWGGGNGDTKSYEQDVESLLKRFVTTGFDRKEDDFNYLLLPLSVLGPNVDDYPWKVDAELLCEYLVKEFAADPMLERLDDSRFALLLTDLDYSWEKAREAYEFYLRSEANRGSASFLAWWLGYEAYGATVMPLIAEIARTEVSLFESVAKLARFPRSGMS
jgi:hypothetical protein